MSVIRAAIAVIALLAAAGLQLAGAQGVRTAPPAVANLGVETPDAEAVREGLFPEDKCEALLRDGNICMGIESPQVTFSLSAKSFAFGSAVLPDSLKRQLDVFAEVLKTKRAGSGQTVRIIGHADVSGSAAGNAALSKRRADEVKRYLVSKGVDSEMLEARGVGSQALLKPDAPTDAENRRVTLGR